ncbi:hypothetical protein MKW94_004332 [Papaver nudicaule]|uniref:Uncharacterized protein n=1 Tax=Papaver nudicaule TaxID=74823 RepID=A0AA41VZQ7_PAPNU|nr:hypothetical protein [Papaver nudicaule]
MPMRRVAKLVSQRLLKGVGNFFADPEIVRVQNALKREAEIAKRGDLAKQKLERIKAQYRLHQELSAEYKAKHGAADKFLAVIVSSAVAVYAWHISLSLASLEALRQKNRRMLE